MCSIPHMIWKQLLNLVWYTDNIYKNMQKSCAITINQNWPPLIINPHQHQQMTWILEFYKLTSDYLAEVGLECLVFGPGSVEGTQCYMALGEGYTAFWKSQINRLNLKHAQRKYPSVCLHLNKVLLAFVCIFLFKSCLESIKYKNSHMWTQDPYPCK